MGEPTTTDLVQQGLTAARVGDLDDARRLLRKATQQTPERTEAWLALAGVVESLEEKETCFSRVLALDPGNREAQDGLAIVQQKLAARVREVKGARGETVAPDPATGLAFCYRHPQIETGLRCNRCNRPICPKCARRTPVGFRCPECIREQENKYYSGGNADYLIAAAIAFPLSLVAGGLFSMIIGSIGLWGIFLGVFVAPAVAGFIAEAVRWGVGKRRSRYLGHVVAGCLILATLPFALFLLWSGSFFGLIGPGMFIFLGAATVLARLR